jgi:flagellar hook assembly protein FlgD
VVPGAGGSAVVDNTTNTGLLVRRIDLGTLSPGPMIVHWDGRNDAGRECAPGAYTAWLTSGSTRVSVKLVRVP